MGGDYQRYLAEFQRDDKKAATIENASKFYEDATEAAKDLQFTDPIRLGLALNFSVFYYEIVQKKAEACSGQERIRRGCRPPRRPSGGRLQGCHPHHAAAAGQPHTVGPVGERWRRPGG